MGVSSDQTSIVGPSVSIADVKTVLHSSSNDLGTLCCSSNINFAARFRPVAYAETGALTWAQRQSALANETLPALTADNLSAMTSKPWSGNLPTGGVNSPFRLTDFLGIGPSGQLMGYVNNDWFSSTNAPYRVGGTDSFHSKPSQIVISFTMYTSDLYKSLLDYKSTYGNCYIWVKLTAQGLNIATRTTKTLSQMTAGTTELVVFDMHGESGDYDLSPLASFIATGYNASGKGYFYNKRSSINRNLTAFWFLSPNSYVAREDIEVGSGYSLAYKLNADKTTIPVYTTPPIQDTIEADMYYYESYSGTDAPWNTKANPIQIPAITYMLHRGAYSTYSGNSYTYKLCIGRSSSVDGGGTLRQSSTNKTTFPLSGDYIIKTDTITINKGYTNGIVFPPGWDINKTTSSPYTTLYVELYVKRTGEADSTYKLVGKRMFNPTSGA